MPQPQTPPVTVDVVVEMIDRPGRQIVLIERRYPPPGWALPGGFVEFGETLGAAARREVREETGLVITLTALLGCYSDPSRDSRGHTVSVVFVGTASGQPTAADDAANVAVVEPDAATELAFDHARIIGDYLRYRRSGEIPIPD